MAPSTCILCHSRSLAQSAYWFAKVIAFSFSIPQYTDFQSLTKAQRIKSIQPRPLISTSHFCKKKMKPTGKMQTLIITAWLTATYAMDALGELLGNLSGLTDWSRIGWAFGASTTFVVWEAIQGTTPRKGWHRLAMVGLGMFLSMAFGDTAAKKLDMDIKAATVLLGLLGWMLLGKLFKKVEKAETIKDLTNITDD